MSLVRTLLHRIVPLPSEQSLTPTFDLMNTLSLFDSPMTPRAAQIIFEVIYSDLEGRTAEERLWEVREKVEDHPDFCEEAWGEIGWYDTAVREALLVACGYYEENPSAPEAALI